MIESPAQLTTTKLRFRSELFVIGLWQEETGDDSTAWYGRMQHVASGEVRFFNNWETFINGLTELTSQIRVP
jgi:hypothetical protein